MLSCHLFTYTFYIIVTLFWGLSYKYVKLFILSQVHLKLLIVVMVIDPLPTPFLLRFLFVLRVWKTSINLSSPVLFPAARA